MTFRICHMIIIYWWERDGTLPIFVTNRNQTLNIKIFSMHELAVSRAQNDPPKYCFEATEKNEQIYCIWYIDIKLLCRSYIAATKNGDERAIFQPLDPFFLWHFWLLCTCSQCGLRRALQIILLSPFAASRTRVLVLHFFIHSILWNWTRRKINNKQLERKEKKGLLDDSTRLKRE